MHSREYHRCPSYRIPGGQYSRSSSYGIGKKTWGMLLPKVTTAPLGLDVKSSLHRQIIVILTQSNPCTQRVFTIEYKQY